MDRRIGKKYRFRRETSANQTSLDEMYEVFYNAKIAEGVSSRTLETYEENYRFLCDYLAQNNIKREPRRVTTEILRQYITWMLGRKRKWEGHAHKAEAEKTVGLSPVTVNTRLKGIRTMFNFLEAEGLLPDNPMKRIKSVREPESNVKVLTAGQLEQLLKTPDRGTYAGFRDYVFMVVLIDGFFRLNEALSLREGDINFKTGLCTLPAERMKNRRSRTVPLSQPTLRLIKQLIKENKEYETDLLFLTNYGEYITDDRMRDRIKEHAKKAGLKVRVYPHLFRHSAATIYLEKGGDIRFLAGILGHSDLRMVQRYTHPSDSAIKAQHNMYSPINDVLGKLAKPRKTKREY